MFEKDCLIWLGTCVVAKGEGKAGKACFKYTINGKSLSKSGQMNCGELLLLLPLGAGEDARVIVEPNAVTIRAGQARRTPSEGRHSGPDPGCHGRPLNLPGGSPGLSGDDVAVGFSVDLYPRSA